MVGNIRHARVIKGTVTSAIIGILYGAIAEDFWLGKYIPRWSGPILGALIVVAIYLINRGWFVRILIDGAE